MRHRFQWSVPIIIVVLARSPTIARATVDFGTRLQTGWCHQPFRSLGRTPLYQLAATHVFDWIYLQSSGRTTSTLTACCYRLLDCFPCGGGGRRGYYNYWRRSCVFGTRDQAGSCLLGQVCSAVLCSLECRARLHVLHLFDQYAPTVLVLQSFAISFFCAFWLAFNFNTHYPYPDPRRMGAPSRGTDAHLACFALGCCLSWRRVDSPYSARGAALQLHKPCPYMLDWSWNYHMWCCSCPGHFWCQRHLFVIYSLKVCANSYLLTNADNI